MQTFCRDLSDIWLILGFGFDILIGEISVRFQDLEENGKISGRFWPLNNTFWFVYVQRIQEKSLVPLEGFLHNYILINSGVDPRFF